MFFPCPSPLLAVIKLLMRVRIKSSEWGHQGNCRRLNSGCKGEEREEAREEGHVEKNCKKSQRELCRKFKKRQRRGTLGRPLEVS